MGSDKALLELNGKPLIALGLEALARFPEIIISAANAETYAPFTGANVRIVPDELPGIGPLGGIISALKAASFDHICFRPVDAPLIPPQLHKILLTEPKGDGSCGTPFDAAVPTYRGNPEPLLACFSKTALPVLESLTAEGKYKAAEAFPLLNTYYIDLETPELISLLGDPAVYLINANTPETFQKLT